MLENLLLFFFVNLKKNHNNNYYEIYKKYYVVVGVGWGAIAFSFIVQKNATKITARVKMVFQIIKSNIFSLFCNYKNKKTLDSSTNLQDI